MSIIKINTDGLLSEWGTNIDWDRNLHFIRFSGIYELSLSSYYYAKYHEITYRIEITINPYINRYKEIILLNQNMDVVYAANGDKRLPHHILTKQMQDAIIMINSAEIDSTSLPCTYRFGDIYEIIERKKRLSSYLNNGEKLLTSIRNSRLADLTTSLEGSYSLFINLRDLGSDLVPDFDFKISNGTKQYFIKDLCNFITLVNEEGSYEFGKNNNWKLSRKAFDEHSQAILNFIYTYAQKFDWRQTCEIYEEFIDEFYNLVNSLPSNYVSYHFKEVSLKINLEIKKETGYYLLNYELSHDTRHVIGKNNIFLMIDGILHRFKLDNYGYVAAFLKSFDDDYNAELSLYINEGTMPNIYQEIIEPNLRYFELSGDLGFINKIIKVNNIRLYSDLEDSIVKVWGNYNLNDQRIGLFEKESDTFPINLIQTIIKKYASDSNEDYAYFKTKGSNLFAFLDQGIPAIQDIAEVYISEELMNLKLHKTMSFNMAVRTENNLLKINFDSNISKEELFAVLNAYRKKKNYYQLKDGQIISLDGEEIKRFDEVVDKMNLNKKDLNQDEIERPIYDAIHFNDYREELDVRSNQNIANYLNHLNALNNCEDIIINDKCQGILRNYQIEGLKWLKRLNDLDLNGILADDMGLGKTIQVLAFLDEFTDHNETNIIICPSSLMYNWYSEIEKFDIDIDAICVHGNSKHREELVNEKHQLYITTYDYLKRDFELYRKKAFNYVILDEAHYIKNATTQNAKSVKLLKAKHRLALTGTPIENSLSELWSIFDFLLPGYLFDHKYFAKAYEQEIQVHNNEERQAELKHLVAPFILRRTKKAVLNDLPDKLEEDLWIEMNEDEEKLYLANLMQVNNELQKQLQAEKVDSILVLAMMTKLRQLCCEPRMVYDNIHDISSKLNACLELIEVLIENKKKVLLFSNFTKLFDLMIDEFNQRGIKYHLLTGKTSKEKRQEEVDAFQNDDSNVFLISLKAGGTGLNLTKAEAVIHFDPWWNLSAQNQATDRAYRIGQTKDVIVYKLLMKNTIEEKIHEMQLHKQEISDVFIENSNISISKMSVAELQDLFRIN